MAVLGWSLTAISSVKVTGLDWVPQGNQGRFVVGISGNNQSSPEWSTKGSRLSMVIPGASLEKGIVRYVGGIRLAAANVSQGVLTTLTFLNGGPIAGENISIIMKDGKIEVATKIPVGFKSLETAKAIPTAPEVNSRKPAIISKSTIVKSDLGEDFLKKLEAESDKKPAPVKVIGKTAEVKAVPFRDEIKNAQAAPKRKDGFSIATYAGKFVAFLGVVLLFFWGIVQMMKKGVLSKGKLGFLNGSSLVSVISTTYVGPKRSLMLVKAHNQVFLVASSEAGFEFLSEVNDVPGLVKEGERFIAGDNFDDIQNKEDKTESKTIKLKQDIYQSAPVEEKPTAKVNRDIARFSDELKKKVKNLKALQ